MNTESEWRNAHKINLFFGALGGICIALAGPITRILGFENTGVIVGLGSGFLGAAVLLGATVYRKPKNRPDRTNLKAYEQQGLKLQIYSAIALSTTLVCTLFFLFLPAAKIIAILIGGPSLAIAIALSFPLLKLARLSRVAPSLNDERSQANLAKAYRNAFTVTFQVSLLGAVFLTFSTTTIETGTTLYLLGFTSMTLLANFTAFYEWRDSRTGDT